MGKPLVLSDFQAKRTICLDVILPEKRAFHFWKEHFHGKEEASGQVDAPLNIFRMIGLKTRKTCGGIQNDVDTATGF